MLDIVVVDKVVEVAQMFVVVVEVQSRDTGVVVRVVVLVIVVVGAEVHSRMDVVPVVVVLVLVVVGAEVQNWRVVEDLSLQRLEGVHLVPEPNFQLVFHSGQVRLTEGK